MIAATQANEPSPHIKRRSRLMSVKTLSPFTYLITPKEAGKARRVVHLDRTDAGVIKIECCDKDTGDVCPANNFGMLCSHVEAALRRLLVNAKRQEKLDAKEQKRSRAIANHARTVLAETKQPSMKGIQL